MNEEILELNVKIWMLFSIVSITLLPFILETAFADNPYLFVSAENSQFDNHFAGSMIVEVVVNDPDLKEIDDGIGEPLVTLNGADLRMVQATDGSWYAYFANINQAKIADQIVVDAGVGAEGESLDFGVFCAASTSSSVLGTSFSETEGVAVPRAGVLVGFTNGQTSLAACTGSVTSTANLNNVVRSSKSINTNPSVSTGQIGLDEDAWPIIQLFSFNDVEIKYSKPGNFQQVNLEYDEIPNIKFELDRNSYPSGAEVFVTISDIQLNQDPTDEDSWTFNINSTHTISFYQAYTESGSDSANGGPGLINLKPKLTSLDFEDNGFVTMDLGSIVELKTNNDQPDSFVFDGTNTYSQIITLVETRPNSGIFQNYDSGTKSTIGILSSAPRGLTGSIQYNDVTKSILSGTSTASINIGIKVGNLVAGQEASVTLTDNDQNLNAGSDDDLDVFRSSAIIPTLQIGNPLTLEGASNVKFYALASTPLAGGTSIGSSVPDDVSDRLVIDTTTAANAGFTKISMNTGYSATSLQSLLVDTSEANTIGTNWLNFDLRSIENQLDVSDFTDTNMTLFFGSLADSSPVDILDSGDISNAQGFIQIDDSDVTSINSKSGTAFLVINFDATDNSSPEGAILNEVDTQPIVIDLFSFGEEGTQDINNAIYRFELEETSNNSGIFSGTIEYAITNQQNVIDLNFISSIRTINDKVKFLVSDRLLDEQGITISYSDVEQVGVQTSQSTKSDILTNSGTVTTSSPTYRFGQTVTMILTDPDLNQKHDSIDVYQVINDPNSPNVDTVGTGGSILLEVKIKDIRYQRCTINGVLHGGLGATGFTLVETGPATGIFQGTFKMPSQICNKDGTELISTAGGSLDAKYHDFRDASGNQNIFSLSSYQKYSTASAPTLNSEKFTLPKYKETKEIILSGTLSGHLRGIPLSVFLNGPNQLEENFAIIPTASGSYRAIILLNHNSPVGTYSINLEYQGKLIGTTSFTVSLHEIPSWIKNNAGWWSSNMVSDNEFFNGMEHLIQEGIIEIPETKKYNISETALPDWIKNNAKWWSDDLISDDEFISALQFLVKKGIIRI